MLASIIVRSSGSEELAKTVHSISASVTTVFLFSRIWARTVHYEGLWWDDYLLVGSWMCLMVVNGLFASCESHFGFRVVNGTTHGWTAYYTGYTFYYLALALSKTAFAVTLIRLSSGRTRTLLWFVTMVVCTISVTLAIVTWLNICGVGVEVASLRSVCVPMATVLWIHAACAIAMVVVDIVLAYLPWQITSKVFIPTQEKMGVSISLSLVGLAVPVCLTRVVIDAIAPHGNDGHMPDWTYGAVIVSCLSQAEVAIYIIAQTLPLLRVLLQGNSGKAYASTGSALLDGAPTDTSSKKAATSSARRTGDNIEEARASIELVQLPGGRIVAGDSEEGREFKAGQVKTGTAGVATPSEGGPGEAQAPEASGQGASAATAEDEVHKLWSDMGISRRAWSNSPPPEAPGQSHQRLG